MRAIIDVNGGAPHPGLEVVDGEGDVLRVVLWGREEPPGHGLAYPEFDKEGIILHYWQRFNLRMIQCSNQNGYSTAVRFKALI